MEGPTTYVVDAAAIKVPRSQSRHIPEASISHAPEVVMSSDLHVETVMSERGMIFSRYLYQQEAIRTAADIGGLAIEV